jgi:hypothetical protein
MLKMEADTVHSHVETSCSDTKKETNFQFVQVKTELEVCSIFYLVLENGVQINELNIVRSCNQRIISSDAHSCMKELVNFKYEM